MLEVGAGGRRITIAPLVCYDAVDPALGIAAARAGAELFVTLSNDSWLDAGDGPRLHLVIAAFRSLETRRPQIRATNTGVSAAIDATGEIVARAGVHERTALVARITRSRAPATLAVAWGDWLGPSALLGSALLLGSRRRTA